jgi:hypothetical protein
MEGKFTVSVLNRSLLNKEYNLINVLLALVPTLSMCSLHVVFLPNIIPRYFTPLTKGIFRPFS